MVHLMFNHLFFERLLLLCCCYIYHDFLLQLVSVTFTSNVMYSVINIHICSDVFLEEIKKTHVLHMYSTQKHFRYTEIAKPKKKKPGYIPKGNRQQPSADTMLPKQKKKLFLHHSPLPKSTLHSLSMPHHFVSNKIMLGFYWTAHWSTNRSCSCIHIFIKILINNLFSILGIYYVIVCILSPLYSLGHDRDLGETTLERWLGDL